ncbi:hypothetical protein [Paenibacillus elgii]|nr:hypothetical protein [Paenibacillus elgii]
MLKTITTIPFYCADKDGNEGWIEGIEATFFVFENKTLYLHNSSGVYTCLARFTHEALVRILLPYGFEELDNNNTCKMNRIVRVDRKERIAYFDNNLQIKISVRNLRKVKHIPNI